MEFQPYENEYSRTPAWHSARLRCKIVTAQVSGDRALLNQVLSEIDSAPKEFQPYVAELLAIIPQELLAEEIIKSDAVKKAAVPDTIEAGEVKLYRLGAIAAKGMRHG